MFRTAAAGLDRLHRSHQLFRSALLGGVSAVALMSTAPDAIARPFGTSSGLPAPTLASDAAAAASAAAQAAAQQSRASMTRALQAIQAMKTAQDAARVAAKAAGTNGVTDGLSAGGLVVDPRVIARTDSNLWINANLPTQTTGNGATTVTVQQTAPRAVMTWQQFNVGRNTILNFDQSGGNSTNGNGWIALNRIDASGVPSQIQGQIKADGTVLLINPNGIIFSGTSQINVHTLIASSMDINSFANPNVGVFDSVSGGGNYVPVMGSNALLAPPKEDNGNIAFVSRGLYVNGADPVNGGGGALAFSAGVTGQSNQGIVVQPGASIATDVSGFDNGGYVALVGPSVVNHGGITTASGQIILAAGQASVALTQPANGSAKTALAVTSDVSAIPLVYLPAIPAGATEAVTTNAEDGMLVSSAGNITLLGDLVSQMGVASATTRVTRAGSIVITANRQVTLGGSSVTSILPDENGETIPQNAVSNFVGPSITIQGDLDMQGTSAGGAGALIAAPSAAMKVTAGTVATRLDRVLLETGSVIDLGGLDATASVADYLYTFKVTANDVADSPLAQNLIGQTVTIDLRQSGTRADGLAWVGSPLFSSSGAGYLNNVPSTIDQLLTKGGSLSFATVSTSNGPQLFTDVLQQAGSLINISGGAIRFTGGMVNTTRLIGSNGGFYDIGSADPSIGYVPFTGFTVNHPHWNVVEIYSSPFGRGGYYQTDYADGVSAGSLAITAINPLLEGSLLGSAVTTERQKQLARKATGSNGAQATPDELPQGGALSVTAFNGNIAIGDAIVLQSTASNILGPDFDMTSMLTLPTVRLVSGLTPSGPTTISVPQLTYSTEALSAAGLGSISISSATSLSTTAGSTLSVHDGGSIKLGGVTTIDGALVAHGGQIAIIGYGGGFSGNAIINAPPVSQLTIGSNALLDVSGLWVNDTGNFGGDLQGSAYIDGGSVTIQTYLEGTVVAPAGTAGFGLTSSSGHLKYPVVDTTQSIVLAKGSTVDVSSGGYVQPNGGVKTGATGLPSGTGGSLSLLTYVSNPQNTIGWRNPLYDFGGRVEAPGAGNIAPTGIDPVTGELNAPNQANVFLDGTIRSSGLTGGGSFALQAPIIQVGGVAAVTSYGADAGAQAGVIALPASFFSSNGFSNYALTSTYGSVTVAAGTTVTLQQQNYQLNGAPPATGASLSAFATRGLALDGLRQPVGLTLSETPYVYGATIYGGASDLSTNAGVLVDAGATILAEPEAQIALTAAGPVTILGRLVAPGGSIKLSNVGVYTDVSTVQGGQSQNPMGSFDPAATLAPRDVWVGANAVLDVGGVYVPDPLVTAYQTGSVVGGGSIAMQGFNVVAMPGSTFDLAGASATVQLPAASRLRGKQLASQQIWSDGGSLALSNGGSLYFDGTVNAAGGAPLASGGSLTLTSRDAIVVSPDGAVTAQFNNQALGADDYPASSAELQNLLPVIKGVYGYISAATLSSGGLDSVALMATTIGFSGNATVKVPGTLTLAGNLSLLPAGAVEPVSTATSIGATTVNLNAGYLLLASNQSAAPTLADGTLNLNASAQIDLAGYISVSNAANVNLGTDGDIRLLSETDPLFSAGTFAFAGTNTYFSGLITTFRQNTTSQSIVQTPGLLAVADNLTLTARELYPSTNSAFLLLSTGLGRGAGPANTITIASNGRAPVAPLSVDGQIVVDAATIVQDGALLAPLGIIQLGLNTSSLPLWSSLATLPPRVATKSVTLTSGSVTSVSADGIAVPYGTTINGGYWSAIDNVLTIFGHPAMTAPPAKAIVVNGASIVSQSGAVLDLSGGGDIYATEFVPGTGGSRNVLAGAASGQAVYALVPTYQAAIAANDAIGGALVAPGTAVTLPGGNGIAAGTYTLLPAIYATLPGAYRVVVVSTNINPLAKSVTTADGSIYTTGTMVNTVNGTRSSQTALLEIQSAAVWSKYSEIDITSADSYFAKLAAASGSVAPALPADSGTLTISATAALALRGTNNFTPAAGGRGGLAQITGSNLLVLASDRTAPAADVAAGYIVLDSDQLSNLGATTLLLGGTSSLDAKGRTIVAGAGNLEIETDAAHPLLSPELVLVANGPAGVNGLTVDAGSVIAATGAIPVGSAEPISFGGGSLLRVSNGTMVDLTTSASTVNAPLVIGTLPGTTTLATDPAAAVIIDGGEALTLATTGTASLNPDTVLCARNYQLAGDVISLGDVPAGTSGFVISPQLIASLAGANSVTLRSGTVFNFYDAAGISFGTASNPIRTLTFDGAGLYGDGGVTSIVAGNVALANSQSATTANALSAAGGTLNIVATGNLTLDAGTKTAGGFAQVSLAAGQQILLSGSGSLDAGAAEVTMVSPNIVATTGSNQSVVTTGVINVQPGAGPAPAVAPTAIGGAFALSGGSIVDAGTITALSGRVTMTASTGDVVLNPGARIVATGSHIVIADAIEDAPGGIVKLAATSGDVTVNDGAVIDVSAPGNGFAGSLVIQTAAAGVATLNGALAGRAAYDDLGGNFTLAAGRLQGGLPFADGFTGSLSVALEQGDVVIPAGMTLTSGQVVLSTNAGSVIVNGTIDASGPGGGSIQLFANGTGTASAGTAGATGVTIGSAARLITAYRADSPDDPAYGNGASTLVQNGGIIVLGTSGRANGTYNAAFGYENIDGSGAISVAPGAIFDVSGGAGGANISNNGGPIIVRAPILTNNNVNVKFGGTVVTSANGGPGGTGAVLDAYAVWSTADASTGAKHFDGIIDPAGWFDNSGNALPGLDQNGYAITAPTLQNPLQIGEFFTPNSPNADHVGFYQTTLVNFVQTPFDAAAIAGDFAGASGLSLGSTLHLQPGITLVNPSSQTNGGNITVASNWNLGAGTADANGRPTLYYRTRGSVDPGEPGILDMLAVNNVEINATISDGFFQPYQNVAMPTINPGSLTTPGQFVSGGTTIDNLAIPAYVNETTTTSYLRYMRNVFDGYFDFDSMDDGQAFNGYVPSSRVGPEVLQPPAVFTSGDIHVIDQYNQSYVSYVAMFDVYANLVWYNEGLYAPLPSAPAHLPPPAPTSATAADYATQGSGYIWQYAQYLVDTSIMNFGNGSSIAPLSTRSLSQVLADIKSLELQDGCDSCYAYAAPFAPYYAGTGATSSAGYPVGDPSSLPAVQPGYVSGQIITVPSQVIAPVGFVPASLASPASAAQIAAAAAQIADAIANNPGLDAALNPQYNTTSSSNLMSVGFAGSKGSFSYNIVGGASVSTTPGEVTVVSADPYAVTPVAAGTATTGTSPSGSVTLNGHISYLSANPEFNQADGFNIVHRTIDVPTLVRTGTGSITIAAAGSFELLDTSAPGAVYTAGAAITTLPSDYSAPTLPANTNGQSSNGLLSTPAWGINGGAVTIIAGSDIVGIEAPVDDSHGSQTLVSGGLTGEFWSAWYYRSGMATGQSVAPFNPAAGFTQNTTWVNYGTFFQGIGALGGGNVTLKAGADVADISASLPETIQVSGGTPTSGAATAHYYGGGNLVVQAGGNLYSSTFYVGRGTGSIQVGGAVVSDPLNPVTGKPTTYYDVNVFNNAANTGKVQSLPLLLAVQDGFISIEAGQSISLGAVVDPAAIPQDISRLAVQFLNTSYLNSDVLPLNLGTTFNTYGPDSGIALSSVTGSIGIQTLADLGSRNILGNTSTTLFGYAVAEGYLTSVTSPTAPATLRALALSGDVDLVGNFTLTPSANGDLSLVAGGSISSAYTYSFGQIIYNLTMLDGTTTSTDGVASLLGAPIPTVLPQAWHANDPTSAIIEAGENINGNFYLTKPARMAAGDSIINTNLLGQNNNAGDITNVIAGVDILAQPTAGLDGTLQNNSSTFAIYGPGTFVVQAGRNLGPFFSGDASHSGSGITIKGASKLISGIATIGDGSNLGSAAVRSYLPTQGASVYALFGVGPGLDYQAAIAGYVDPAVAGSNGVNYLTYIAEALGQAPGQAWTTFQALPVEQQRLLIDRAYLKFLSQVGLDYNDATSPYYHQYGRAYATIATLFPAAFGYTDNRPSGVNGAAVLKSTGDLNMASSLLETQSGGDIHVIGPGGGIVVGANAADNTPPQQEGILTLQGGSILTYTDGSVLVYQSRIFTEQGGDIDMFSANGDLNAGKGPKSSAAYPPLSLIWTVDGYARVNPAGLVTGAGIGALLSVPGQDPRLSNVNLVAPRGTVDAGAAGIRVSGNLNIAALQVLNAFNIQVGGTSMGIPTVQGPPVAALTSATNTAGSAVRTEAPAQNAASSATSVMVVEIIGYGGGDGGEGEASPAQPGDKQRDRRSEDQPSYNSNSAFQIVGVGDLSEQQKQRFSASEQRKLTGNAKP